VGILERVIMKISLSKWTLVAIISLASVAAAQSPLVGSWKFNAEKSQLTGDTIQFVPASDGMIRVTSGGQSYSFKPDGSDTATPMGYTTQWKKVDDQTWKQTVMNGSTKLSENTYTLSGEGKTMTLTSEGTKPNGEKFNDSFTYTRMSGTNGFMGDWKSTKVDLKSFSGYKFKDRSDGALVWSLPDYHATVTIQIDGKDYPATGPTVPEGLTLSLTKTGPRTFTMVEKMNGKPIYKATETVSADGKTLEEVGSAIGVNETTISIYEKID
jgi:dipeptidyl aminopeptidase/acylaminoacyl peptidase